jgi:hypothetical protein
MAAKTRSATVKTSTEVKPRRPRVDREGEAEQHVRQLFKNEVDLWINGVKKCRAVGRRCLSAMLAHCLCQRPPQPPG